MPTGYTSAVQDGTVTTLQDYALRCARAFGACIDMRDSPTDAAIPDAFEAHTQFYDEKIAEAQKILAEVPEYSVEECETCAQAAFEAASELFISMRQERLEGKMRYEAMACKVWNWQVPADLFGLRDFMAEQLRSSIEFDCSLKYLDKPKKLKAEEWRTEQLEKADRDLKYGTEKRDEEIARTAERNEWLRLLRVALNG